jgi:hypothetical protein
VSTTTAEVLVAYSATSLTNLKVVDRVVRLVRELDLNDGSSAAGRRRLERERLETPAE